jgi:hypothetical protein
MNGQAKPAGETAMTNSDRNSIAAIDKCHRADRRTTWAIGAGALIALGLALQWIQVLFTQMVSQNSWFFATLFGETWNMITVWLSAAPWHEDVQYWPLLLVITGAAILFSRSPRRAMATNESRTGARRDA